VPACQVRTQLRDVPSGSTSQTAPSSQPSVSPIAAKVASYVSTGPCVSERILATANSTRRKRGCPTLTGGAPPLSAMSNEGTPLESEAEDRKLRVVIAEDTALLREGIVSLLREAGHEVVGQSGTEDELLATVRATSPDVAVIDMRMPPTHSDEGLRAARE